MNKESFYDWCINNDHQSFLLRWDEKLNNKQPNEVSVSNGKKYYFKCENGLHDSEVHRIADIKRHNKLPGCSYCNSFGKWCEDNNRLDLLKRWDYDLNNITPYDISISSTKKQYFKCPKGIHQSELKNLNNIRKQYGSGLCNQCNSIGQYGIDNIDIDFINKYWSEKNKKNPFEINKLSPQKMWIKCINTNYHDDYEISAVNFFNGERCPYCAKKKIHFLDSLGNLYKKVINIWSDKNKFSPFDVFPSSNKFAFWKCENNIHPDYKRRICDSLKSNFDCPQCVKIKNESKLQEKVRLYLESIFVEVNHEYKCSIIAKNPKTNRPLPYDNEVPEIKLIIEVNGIQHYKKSSFYNNKEKLEYRQYLDKIKQDYAISQGYYFLIIPYWTDDDISTWKYMINKKIKSIVSQNNI